MKTKLTLTVKKDIILSAKRIAKRKNISVSKLFEEMFKDDEVKSVLTPAQKAAKKLLKQVGEEFPISNKSSRCTTL